MKSRKSGPKKLLAGILATLMIFAQSPYTLVLAQSVPEAPVAPTAPSVPDETTTPPPEPTAPVAPNQPVFQANPSVTPTPVPTSTNDNESDDSSGENSGGSSTNNATSSPSPTPSQAQSATPSEGTGAQISDGGTGSVTLATGDADNVGNITTNANSNISSMPSSDGGGGAVIVNDENGSGSSNNGSVSTASDTNNIQSNSATVGNNLYQTTVSGENSASENTGGDTNLITGDVNTSGTIMNTLNTNVNGIAVYEFNIADDQLGDYVLDFSDANCVSGCTTGSLTAANTANGADSTNTAGVSSTTTDNSFQTNDATVENNMVLESNSGDNYATKNTGGNTAITTGDANVQGSVLNFVNNNVEGNVVYAVVNVFGNLTGDIVLPDGTVLSCCIGSATAANTANGADSTNTANIDQNNADNTYQFNTADIQNNLILTADTGSNQVDKNTNGDVNVESGDTNVTANVLNVANTNIIGGNWWLVIVNEAGKWIGRIMGAPEGQNFAGSEGFEFAVGETGEITAVNAGNGADSNNAANISDSNTSTTSQSNNAAIVNNIALEANTGGNNASKNTGGDSSVQTGDANIIANIVNFVNNNIVGTGKLFVTVVNVFGSWLGDFVGPGQKQDEVAAETSNNNALGGSTQNSSSSSSSEASNNTVVDNEETGTASTSTFSNSNALKTNVLGTSGHSGSNPGGSISLADSSSESVALVADDSIKNTAGRKVLKINLAWFTLIVPFGVWYIFKKRKFAFTNTSAQTIKG